MKLFKNPLFRLIYVIAGVFMIIGLSHSIYDLWKKQDIIVDRQNALKQAEAENKRLKKALEESQTPDFIEREARNSLGMSKEGEIVVLMDTASGSGTTNSQPGEAAEKPSWKLWWRLFY
jgi:cell division protein FtsB